VCMPPHRKGSIPCPRALCSQSVDIQTWRLSAAWRRGWRWGEQEALASQLPVSSSNPPPAHPAALVPVPSPYPSRRAWARAQCFLPACSSVPEEGGPVAPSRCPGQPGSGDRTTRLLSASLPAGTSLIQHLMTVLIRKHSQLFTAPTPEGPTSPRGGQQCAVGWGSEEVTRDSQGESGGPGLPTHRTSSLDGAAVAVLSRTAPTGPGSRCSPGKKVQTLPSWKSSFRQPGSRSGSPKGGGSSLEVPIISSGGNWLMNGLSSLRGHRRASSGDRLKDSGSVQRLSTYDNVPAAGLVPGTPSVASMAWSGASSSESSAGGSLSSCTACRASDSSRSSLHTEWALEPSPLPSSSEDPKSLDLGHSLDEAGTGASNSEPGSPTRERARRSEALQGLVAELRAELCRQRTEYERSVKRMEEGSADLRKQMSRLEEELDQEKKKYIMLEIKLRNSERAREDAERRNQLLQKEMEEFFSTLGNLTVGAKGARAPK
uniref:Rho GTPase activating protein 22 n=1 Tax=Saimiri boliviensis boliviensis TaxID=39432 RepID=A0A2K6TXC3_SAIBB